MKLKKYLENKNLTNYQVCKKAEVGQSTLSQFINGKRKNVSFDTACKISDALGIKLDEFRELSKERGEKHEKI